MGVGTFSEKQKNRGVSVEGFGGTEVDVTTGKNVGSENR